MSYHLGTDNADEQAAQQNDILPEGVKPPEQMQIPLPVIPGPSDVTPLTPLIPMGPSQKSFMEKFTEKLAEPGPLGVTWKFWAIGAAVVAGVKYMSAQPARVTANRGRKRRRR